MTLRRLGRVEDDDRCRALERRRHVSTRGGKDIGELVDVDPGARHQGDGDANAYATISTTYSTGRPEETS